MDKDMEHIREHRHNMDSFLRVNTKAQQLTNLNMVNIQVSMANLW